MRHGFRYWLSDPSGALVDILAALGIAALVALSLGCDGDKPGHSSSRVTLSDVDINQAPCSVFVLVLGNRREVTGQRSSTVTVGDTTITFGPDCSSTIEAVTPPSEPV